MLAGDQPAIAASAACENSESFIEKPCLVKDANVSTLLKRVEGIKCGVVNKIEIAHTIRLSPKLHDDIVSTIVSLTKTHLKSRDLASECMDLIGQCGYALHLAGMLKLQILLH